MNATAKRYLVEAFAWFVLALGFLLLTGCRRNPTPEPQPLPVEQQRTAYSPTVAVSAAEAAMTESTASPAPLPSPPVPDLSGSLPIIATDAHPTGPTATANGAADTDGREAELKPSSCRDGQCGSYYRKGLFRRIFAR